MKEDQYIFSCSTGEFEDLQYLYELFNINDIDSEIQGLDNIADQMGLEDVVIALITSAVIPSVFNVIKIWLQNRGKEITIEKSDTGERIRLISKNGKAFSDSEMERLVSFFEEKNEE